eukprot:TRINITY_DN10444_c0_g1_i2.p1 TRINITY_DN10444_c0_g1~~TRINITY_DN10444_c0_g1_i2.p1  ORF type:complete len:150 (+),score=36.23 TRINITY_DN10444_c0_g1_i2:98-547(+)
MPQLFENVHDKFIHDYLMRETAVALKVSKRLIFPLNTQGIIIPCNLVLKVLPDIANGVVIAGFITRAKYIDETRLGEVNVMNKEVLLVLLDGKMNVHGFNRKLPELMGVEEDKLNMRKYLRDRQNRYLPAIFPDIFLSLIHICRCRRAI